MSITSNKFDHALSLHKSGNLAEAEAVYHDILRLEPHHVDALHYLGVAAYQRHKFDEADRLINQALAIKSDDCTALNNHGNVLLKLGRLGEALERYNQALAIAPHDVHALSNRGNVLLKLKRPEKALVMFDRALAVNPSFVDALYNRGNAFLALQQREEAVVSYDAVLAIEPDHVAALYNRGNALLELQRWKEALVSYQQASTLDPDHAEAHMNESICHLLGGDFRQGWPKYEWRWHLKSHAKWKWRDTPNRWLGKENLSGKTLLVHSEQGYGDAIQFCRYAAQLAEDGVRVVLEVKPPLTSLLSDVEGVAQLIAKGEPLPDFDFHCPLMSLPLALNATLETIPAQVPYIKAQPHLLEKWRRKLPETSGPRVGIAWSGRAEHNNDAHRSIAARQLAPLLACGMPLISLQKEYRDEDREWLKTHPGILDFSDELTDFSDTAALASLMDVVISVDTSVAHLAGALGLPVWIMLPFIALDWRWLLDRDDSPWYPTARLFRQTGMNDSNGVIEQVAHSLRNFSA